jgi:acyl-CoA dehydrogenase
MIFGQGAIRCHPFVLRELHAAQSPDREAGLAAFDDALSGHVGYALSNAARALVLGATSARWAEAPTSGPTRRYYQHITRFSAAFALVSDTAMLTLGGALKKKEMLSARLGDMLSNLYLASMVLKHFENQGRPEADLPLVEWSCRFLLYRTQEQLHGFLRNFPLRWVALGLRLIVFPRGRLFSSPRDTLSRRIVEAVSNPGETRDRLCDGVYRTLQPGNPLGLLQEAMELSIEVAPLEKKLRKGVKDGKITAPEYAAQLDQALGIGLLSAEEVARMRMVDEKVMALIHVDDFSPRQKARPRPARSRNGGGRRSLGRSTQRLRAACQPPTRSASSLIRRSWRSSIRGWRRTSARCSACRDSRARRSIAPRNPAPDARNASYATGSMIAPRWSGISASRRRPCAPPAWSASGTGSPPRGA